MVNFISDAVVRLSGVRMPGEGYSWAPKCPGFLIHCVSSIEKKPSHHMLDYSRFECDWKRARCRRAELCIASIKLIVSRPFTSLICRVHHRPFCATNA
eukprot:scaffold237823_cov36-Prasinocladus_malaysianus.AAC.1